MNLIRIISMKRIDLIAEGYKAKYRSKEEILKDLQGAGILNKKNKLKFPYNMVCKID